MKKLLSFYILIVIPIFAYSQDIFIPKSNGNLVFRAFLKDIDNSNPLEWSNKYGGYELPKGAWNPPEGYYVIFRNLKLRYWFIVDENEIQVSKTDLDNMIQRNSSLKGDRSKGYLMAYTQFIPKGAVIQVDRLLRDGAVEIDGLKKTKAKLDERLGMFEKELNTDGGLEKILQVDKESMELTLNNIILGGNPSAQAIYQSLKSKYQNKTNNKEMPASVGEVWRDMVNDDYKAQEYKEAGLDPNAAEQVQDYNNAKNNKGSNKQSVSGLKGPFKIKMAFSKWVALTIKLVARYFGVEEIGYRILMGAYLIAPELFDFCGSYLAKIQHAITAKTLNEFLDNVATIVEYADQFYTYARQIESLLSEKNLKELVENIDFKKFDFGKTLEVAQKMKIIDKSTMDKINKWVPVDMINGKVLSDKRLFNKTIFEQAKKRTSGFIDQKLQKLGLPLSVTGLANCDNQECVKSQLKEQALNMAIYKVPPLNRNRIAIEHLIKGDIKNAIKSVASTELARQLGINAQGIDQAINALANNDYKGFLLKAIDVAHQKYQHCPELTKDLIELLRSNKVSIGVMKNVTTCVLESVGKKDVANQVRQGWNIAGGLAYAIDHQQDINNVVKNGFLKWFEQELQKNGYTKEQIKGFIEGKAQDIIVNIMKEQIKSVGFDAEGAVEAIMQGDFNKAMELQIAHSTEPIPTKEKIRRSKQALEMRYKLLKDIQDRMKNCLLDPSCLESLTLKISKR